MTDKMGGVWRVVSAAGRGRRGARHRTLRLLGAKAFPAPSAHKAAKRAASSSSFPSVWGPGLRGQILQRPDREGAQGGGLASARLRTPPPVDRRSRNSKHFNGGFSDPPHSTHGTRGPPSSPPSQGKTKPHTQPRSCPRPQSCRPKSRLGYHLLVLLPAGSMRDKDKWAQPSS